MPLSASKRCHAANNATAELYLIFANSCEQVLHAVVSVVEDQLVYWRSVALLRQQSPG